MAEKFSVSVELSASDLASPVIKRARDTYADFGDEIGRTLRQAGIRVRDFNDEAKKLEAAAAAVKQAFAQGELSVESYNNALAQVTTRQATLAKEMSAAAPQVKQQEEAFAGFANRIPVLFAAAAAAVGVAIKKMISDFSEWQARGVEAALETERALKNLNAATFKFGEASAGIAAGLAAQSEALSQLSTQSRTAIIQAQALAASMSRTPDEIERVVSVALRLTQVFGGDLETNTRALAGTLEGNLVRSLKQLIPELDGLSDASLRSGEAIRIVDERIPAATTNLDAYEQALLRVKKAQQDNAEAAGNAVIQSEELIDLQNRLANATERGRESGSALGVVWEKLKLTFQLGAQELANSAANLLSWTTNAELAARRAAEYAAAVEAAAEAQRKLNAAQAQTNEEKIASAREAAALAARAHGIALRDLASEEESLVELERQLTDLLRTATVPEQREYTIALEATRKKLAEVRGETDGASTSLRDFGAANAEAATGVRALNTEQAQTASLFNATASAADRAAAAIARAGRAGGQPSQISQGTRLLSDVSRNLSELRPAGTRRVDVAG